MTEQALISGPEYAWFGAGLKELRRDRLEFVRNLAQYGDISRWQLIGPIQFYMLNHPDYVHEVLVKQRDVFIKEPEDLKQLRRFLGNGLLTNEGADHRRQRKLIQPAFHHQRLKSYAATMVEFGEALLRTWTSGAVLNIDAEMTKLTLEIVAKVLFSANVSEAEAAAVSAALDELQAAMTQLEQMVVPVPEWVPIPANRRIRAATSIIDKVVYRVIEERRSSGAEHVDLLDTLLHTRYEDNGELMSVQQVRDEVITLFLAGHETTANALTWTFYLLAQHRDAVERLHAELDSVLAGRSPTVDDLPNLTWTEMIIKESLRLYPPAWGLSLRVSQTEVQLGPYTLPAKSAVGIFPYTLHRDPRWWPNPERFDPERFTPEAERSRPRYAYIPFGGGDRICIGNAFAMMEATLLLATLAQRFDLYLQPNQTVELEPLITLGPADGIWMQAQAR